VSDSQQSRHTEVDPVVPDLRIVSKNASEQDVAAVTAVLRGALAEHAAGLELQSGSGMSAWERSQRPIRSPLTPHAGSWRGFSG
jgi:hypothetical protein